MVVERLLEGARVGNSLRGEEGGDGDPEDEVDEEEDGPEGVLEAEGEVAAFEKDLDTARTPMSNVKRKSATVLRRGR